MKGTKLFKIAGSLIVGIPSVIAIFDWLYRPDGPDLVVNAEFADSEFPESVKAWHKSMCEAYSSSKFREFLEQKLKEGQTEAASSTQSNAELDLTYERERIARELVFAAEEYQSELDTKLYNAPEFDDLERFVSITVENSGDLPANDLAIQFKDSRGYASVKKNGKILTASFANQIAVGDVGAEETVEVTAWMDKTYRAPSDFLVVHEGGKQRASFPTAVGGLLAFLARNQTFIIFALVLLAPVIIVILAAVFASAGSQSTLPSTGGRNRLTRSSNAPVARDELDVLSD